jgi:uncharacterized membrane protein YkvA (DUF1232 family)
MVNKPGKSDNNTFKKWYIETFLNSIHNNNPLTDDLPEFLDLLCNIITCKDTNFNIKVLCSLALSYIVIEDDYYPDSKINGYLDDMFIITYALKQIKDKSPELILMNWNHDEDILQIIQTIFDKIYVKVKDDMLDILKLIGMDKYSLYNTDNINCCLSP